jgi:hypothetical protein
MMRGKEEEEDFRDGTHALRLKHRLHLTGLNFSLINLAYPDKMRTPSGQRAQDCWRRDLLL